LAPLLLVKLFQTTGLAFFPAFEYLLGRPNFGWEAGRPTKTR
jgi:hypothetical protein